MKLLLMLVTQLTQPAYPPQSEHSPQHSLLKYPNCSMLVFFRQKGSLKLPSLTKQKAIIALQNYSLFRLKSALLRHNYVL
jgi:hypothetical protein